MTWPLLYKSAALLGQFSNTRVDFYLSETNNLDKYVTLTTVLPLQPPQHRKGAHKTRFSATLTNTKICIHLITFTKKSNVMSTICLYVNTEYCDIWLKLDTQRQERR